MKVDKSIFPDVGEIPAIDGTYSIRPFYRLNEKIPESAAICLTGKGSAMTNLKQIRGDGVVIPANSARDRTKIFLIYGEMPDGDWTKYYDTGRGKWGYDATTPPEYANSSYIITSFDITKICFLIFVGVKRSLNSETVSTFTLREYIEQYKADYPYIVQITAKAYVGGGTREVSNRINLIYEYDLQNLMYISSVANMNFQYTYPPILTYAMRQGGQSIFLGSRGVVVSYTSTASNVYSGVGWRFPLLCAPELGELSATLTSASTSTYRYWSYGVNVSSFTSEGLMIELTGIINRVCPLFWTDNENSAKNSVLGSECTDDHIFFAGMVDGELTGAGTRGEQIGTDPRAVAWERSPSAPFDQSSYYGDDTNEYTDTIPIYQPTVPVIGQFNRAYVMGYTHVRDLASYLWSADDMRLEEILNGLKMFGENPINAIIDLRLYPFDLRNLLPDTLPTPEFIKLGRATSPAIGYELTNPYPVIDLGECTFYRYFGDFRDFPPYTTAELYIPYIGKVPLDPSVFAGHRVSIKLICDIITGAAVAMIYADKIPVLYQSGVIGVSVPITGDNAAAYASGVISSLLGNVPSISAVAEAAETSFAAAGAVLGEEVAKTAASYTSTFLQPTQFQSAGGSSPNCAIYQPQQCYITIYQAQSKATAGYGHTSGYACSIYEKVGSFSGFTVFANPDLSGVSGATEQERQQIADALTSGIYI